MPTICGWSMNPAGRRRWRTCWRGSSPNTVSWSSAALGNPCTAPEDIVWLVDELKKRVSGLPPVRINTNGHANLILGQDVTPRLQGRIDTLSISLNGSTPEEYCAVTRPRDGEKAWHAMLDFAGKAKEYVPNVVMTIVDKDQTPEAIERCRRITRDLGVKLRIRAYIPD